MFLYNAWYVAAWSSEVGAKPLGRTLLNEPVVLYRTGDGGVAALEDRCCHRGMPLSCGAVFGNNIRCEYHGMVFDPAGGCVEIPGQAIIPRSARVRSFPVAERDDLIWIWMGEPALADVAKIPSYPWHKLWPYKSKTERIDCNYLLLSDNLLDQTHGAYVHKSTLASNVDAYERAEMTITSTPDGVKFIRWMLNCMPPGIYARAVPFKGRVDRWGEFEYVAPSCILQFTGARDVGEGAYENDARDGGFGLRIFYGITPETEHTSWFLWSTANSYRQDDPHATEELFEEIERAFKEDEDVLVAQYATLRRLGDRPLINIASDGARVQARRALERKIAEERGIPREDVVTLA
ncbi:aromatic ring-hydroxylating dioxygenase subunit alpha [Bradyrhizobium sp. U87765 SZCCT0131]|uniref:aromatic ring-hydroxylating dioxygenase subunit alpha n=1 Tax=unclassified Bradyrhizobium TaxID=2631580 RepID=UPI001BAB71DC|nr:MULTISPECIES: aromatic ring-hydroxylating dioxygenase subunit alpha [unclassified Bradyrhizobium]MBR1223043.1 aromatic ring-hydroxylating dioxygenase subunit alpha [Bradyrhizobium sp. U87765 SZCCT0131]MBR1262779.1 aromatic ring-hydroxylating dioxygenase subunit alpha [Bradyrhizobium sp. U87765 SZCCT0134]MBR1308749.1 aromatic ring-hydroxylating dioxygenase subunit alpha [Bradyrhizobium sp. U87765 SZCCT0110]MBR1318561.1 aromatic ring-hydroxylating dioxygenase subunit alpha [Bradyrhizobium sp. 